MSQVIEIEEEEVETEKAKKAYLVVPNGHREATVLAFTTVLVGNKPVNITLRAGWTEAEIDSIFEGMEYIGKLVDLRNGLFVTSNQYSYIETDEEDYVTGMRKIPATYDNAPAKQAQPTEPVNSPFAPGDDAPHTPAQPAKQYQQPAPQQGQGKSDLIVFEVDRVEWASMMPSKSKPGQFTTTFRAYDAKGYYKNFGVVCYPEALQKAGFDIGGATGGWTLNLAGQGWFAHCFPSDKINQYGEHWPNKVAYFTQEQAPF